MKCKRNFVVLAYFEYNKRKMFGVKWVAENFKSSTNLYDLLSEDGIDNQGNSINFIEKSMERDKLLIQAIQSGNRDMLEDVTKIAGLEQNKGYYYGNPILKGEPLRTRKNGMIIRNTLCRVAGELGGVAAIYLHLVFEKYAIQIEQATTTDYLEHVVTPNMFAEYCDLVANYSTLKYSPLIKEIVIFIGNHLREELNVSNLAATFHVNSSHLARKFKKETGYTISEYVNNQKIEAAKLLFQGGEVTVGEVSEKLGYNSNSYFSKIFKKITGKSPVVYLKSLHN